MTKEGSLRAEGAAISGKQTAVSSQRLANDCRLKADN
jgi:hypothetical protein